MLEKKGLFVVIEGSNGAGKTTLLNNLKEKGYEALSSPNGTDLARLLRPACRGVAPWEGINKKIQFLLFSAARYDEYVQLVHSSPNVVVADRWWTSTYVYQCVLQGISVEFMEHTIHEDEEIDLVVILDGDDEVLLDRMRREREKNPSHGKCTWTKDEDALKNLMRIYREELPKYLEVKKIPYIVINTNDKNTDEVTDETFKAVEALKND